MRLQNGSPQGLFIEKQWLQTDGNFGVIIGVTTTTG
jgi:hypothetical protein